MAAGRQAEAREAYRASLEIVESKPPRKEAMAPTYFIVESMD